eukprot:5205457-Pyramimonas_sp.AAC.1
MRTPSPQGVERFKPMFRELMGEFTDSMKLHMGEHTDTLRGDMYSKLSLLRTQADAKAAVIQTNLGSLSVAQQNMHQRLEKLELEQAMSTQDGPAGGVAQAVPDPWSRFQGG